MITPLLGTHEIIPARGSAIRERDGEPADLRNALHYSGGVRAICLECTRPIRCASWLSTEGWVHIPEIPSQGLACPACGWDYQAHDCYGRCPRRNKHTSILARLQRGRAARILSHRTAHSKETQQ